MNFNNFDKINQCVPIEIKTFDRSYGPRIGGSAPDGIAPQSKYGYLKYFLTIPLIEFDQDVSIFVTTDFDIIYDRKRTLQKSGPVVAIAHEARDRGTSNEYASEISSHAIELKCICNDEPKSKLGGKSEFFMVETSVIENIDTLYSLGYYQVVDIGFPGSNDAKVKGNWPFGEESLHVYGRKPYAADDWMFIWA